MHVEKRWMSWPSEILQSQYCHIGGYVVNIIMHGSPELKKQTIWVANFTEKNRIGKNCLICGDVTVAIASCKASTHSSPKKSKDLQASWNLEYIIPETFLRSSKLNAPLTWFKRNLWKYISPAVGRIYVRQPRLNLFDLVVHSKSQTNVKPPEQQIHDSYFNHQIK